MFFTRVSPFGMESIAVRLASREGISTDEARESLMEVGLEEELDLFDEEAEVDAAREVLEEGATKLVEELRHVDGLLRGAGGGHPRRPGGDLWIFHAMVSTRG